MAKKTLCRRRHERRDARYAVVLRDTDGVVLGKGQTVNISDGGTFAVIDVPEVPEVDSRFLLEIDIPPIVADDGSLQRQTAHFVARLVRTEHVDELIGLGMEFVERIG